jgi:hypothetical protein
MGVRVQVASRLELESARDGGVLDDYNDAVLDNKTIILSLCLHDSIFVDELHVGTDARILVNNAFPDVPANHHTCVACILCPPRHTLSGTVSQAPPADTGTDALRVHTLANERHPSGQFCSPNLAKILKDAD